MADPLDACGGCAGTAQETPLRIDNRAGLNQIATRIGTHTRFLHSMLARLSSAQLPALRGLKTRASDDLTIALLDACAAVDDGLTFYTERYANEWYIRTATERVSLVQLARLIGYEPRPGVAAGTYLAFTIEDTPGTPELTSIATGTRVMSIPGKDELPQFFETSATIDARSDWNAMRARTRAPQLVSAEMELVVVQGIESGIRRGDRLLIVVSDSETKVKRVRRVALEPAAGVTRLELGDAPSPSVLSDRLLGGTISLGSQTLNDSSFGSIFTGQVYSSSDVLALGSILGWSTFDFGIAANVPSPPPPAATGVYALRTRAAVFGHNAPSWSSLPQVVEDQTTQLTGYAIERLEIARPKRQYPDSWDELDVLARTDSRDLGDTLANTVDLDNTYPAITEEGWVVLESPSRSATAYRVTANQELTRNDFTLSTKVTRLTLADAADLSSFTMRDTTVYGQSDQLPLAMVPLTEAIKGDRLVLDAYYPGLVKGQLVVLSGTRTDLAGVPGSEVRELADVLADGALETGRLFTVLVFRQPLSYSYQPETVIVNANVVAATHGETKAEVLGGGDGVTRYQTFVLRQASLTAPLTYLSAPTPTGSQSTLEVRVNDVRWEEAPTLYGHDPDDRVYVVRHEDSGQTKVQFNAPLPSGQENVRATYRVGIGLAGMLQANQLSMLAVRPLGVRAVTNPLPPSGAEDRETIEDVRDNSPLTVLTLDRLVSLRDYQDFARAFAGFSKALATPTSDGVQRGVFLTVAGETGAVSETSAEFSNLVLAIHQLGDPFVNVVVKPYRPAFFQVEATIGVDPAYIAEAVAAQVRTTLTERFSFSARQFGQSVTAVEVIAAIQQVAGVTFANLTALFRSDPLNPTLPKSLDARLTASLPEPGTSPRSALAAELLTIDPRPIQIATVVA